MISIVVPIGMLPDGTKTRKVYGEKAYTVHRRLQIFGESSRVIMSEHVVYMLGEDGTINGVTEDVPVAVDFQSVRDAADFLIVLEGEHETD